MEPFYGKSEEVRLDRRRLAILCCGLTAQEARHAVFRAMDEIESRMNVTREILARDEFGAAAKVARGMVAISDELGLASFSRVAADVARCAARGDRIAAAATMERLIRIGDISMAGIWDVRDLSI